MKFPTLPGFDQQAFDKYLKNTGWLMFGKVLSMLVGFLVARILGPNPFGNLSFADALTAIVVGSVGTLGLDSFVIRELLNHPEKRDEILGTSFAMRAVVSVVLVPVAIGIYAVYHSLSATPGSSLVLIVSFFAVFYFFKSFNIIDSYFQSQVQSRYVVRVQNSCLLLSSALKVTLVLLHVPLVYIALSFVFDGAILAAGLVLAYRSSGLQLSTWKYDHTRAISLIKQSWPLIISAVMISLYMKIDMVMLKNQGSEEVGIYSAAARLSESWYFIPVAVVTSVFPAIIHIRRTDSDKYRKRLRNLYDLLVGISLPVALLISFTANGLIHLIYGAQFHGAGLMLSIHIWSGIFVFLGSASSQYLLAEGYNHISFIRTGIGAVVNIALNLWLIPKHGGVGASVATLAAYCIATFSVFFFKRTREQGILMLRSLFLISIAQTVLNRGRK